MRTSFLNRLSGKEFYVFTNTFTEKFLDVLSYILPTTLENLFENELIRTMSDLNTQFLKKYAYAFVAEAKHFLTSNPEIVKQISEHG